MSAAATVVPEAPPRTDAELSADGSRGDRAARAEFYDRHAPRAYRLAAALCLDPHRAARAVEQAFVAASRGLPVGHSDLPAVVWLLITVQRCAASEARDSGQVYAPFARMGPEAAQVVGLSRLGGLSCSEIADGLGVPCSSVKALMREGLHAMLRAHEGNSAP
ncbi:hypothetical protein DSM112329_03400 [Paraconexibacter sp. AEG42_29]|uniref:RNA polymerase sigma-70 region 4 domain-containing protein n=2 Tax=Paraconexibacter sp. AEG42_29 TaxID=2997339 RepID=A0AAU7AY42_9ACTN